MSLGQKLKKSLILLVIFVLLGQLSFPLSLLKAGYTASCELAIMTKDNQVLFYQCSEEESLSQALSKIYTNDNVKIVYPIQNYHLSLIEVNDLGYQYQKSYLEQIKAAAGWEKAQQLKLRPVIAILDSGVDIDNADLKPNIWFNAWEVPGDKIDNDKNGFIDDQYGWDFVNDLPDPKPKFEAGWTELAMQHGTVVAGVAAAVGNNVQGVTGVSWTARLMPLRVLDAKGVGNTVTVARAINYAVANGADIINLSFVGPFSDPILEEAIRNAYQAGVLVVAASGTEQSAGINLDNRPQYPVCDDGFNGENQVIGVAAVTADDKLADFSNYGSRCIDVSAPGVKIFSTQFQDNTKEAFKDAYGGYWSGTSVAAPMVSGALALLKAVYPYLSPSQLRDVIIASGDVIDNINPSFSKMIGRRLNIQSAFALADRMQIIKKSPLVVTPLSRAKPQVQIYDYSGEQINSFLAYNPNFTSGVNVAAGDINGDGRMEIVTAPRTGGGPHIRIFNQRGVLLYEFMAFLELYHGGVSLAVADINGDKKDEIIMATGSKAVATVRIFDGDGNLLYQFLPYDTEYSNGLNIAAGDLNNDGRAEIIIAPQVASKLPVRILTHSGKRLFDLKGVTVGTGGLFLAIGDINNDRFGEIAVANGKGGNSLVRLFNNQGDLIGQFWAYAKNFFGGVNMSIGDVDGDGFQEIVTTAGIGGGPHLRIFNKEGNVKLQFFVGDKKFRGGLDVAVFK